MVTKSREDTFYAPAQGALSDDAVSDVVLETKVLVSRRLEDKKIKSWS